MGRDHSALHIVVSLAIYLYFVWRHLKDLDIIVNNHNFIYYYMPLIET